MTAGTGQIKAQMQFNDNLKVDADTKPYFHARPLAYDGDCGCESCWVDADGKPVGRRILVKTNVPAWACLWQNVAAEIDIIPHFSFELPIYWSPYNYGKRTLKFRTFSIIPKFRYYPSPDNDGLFFDVHAGFAYYNVALDGNHRYQDHNGKTPALGGGIGVGYRFRLPQSPRWKIEVALGAGFYGLDYDVFKNGSNLGSVRNLTIDGAKINTLAALPAKHATGVAVGWVYTSGPIENVTVRNAKIDSYRWTGGVVGKGYGSVNNCTVENIDITLHFEKTAEGWDNCDKAGGIMGQQDEGGYTLTGNKATNINIVGYRHVGALFGYVNSGYDNSHKTMTGNTATGGILTQTLAHNYNTIASRELFGEITGFLGNNVDQSGNSHSGVVINAAAIVNNAATLVTAATNGGYIVLDGNIDMSSVSGSITLTQPTNIDLNGNNLTLKSGALVNNSVLTIDGEGSIASDGYTITGEPDSKIVINGGTISSKGTESYSRTIHTAGDIEINGGTISNEKREALQLNWPNEYNKAHTAVINGGTIKTDYDYALNAYAGACRMQHKLVINGGTFIGMSGARIDGNINATIQNGIFIQTSPSSTGHALCVGAESYGSNLSKVTVNNGYFHGNAGFAICNANSATTVVNGGFLNKQGGGFTLGTGKSLVQLSSPTTLNVEGRQYSFSFQVK